MRRPTIGSSRITSIESPSNLRVPAPFLHLLRPLLRTFGEGSFYVVGGCVRDWLLKVETKDLDLVVEGNPGPLARFCRRRWGGVLDAFDRFGTLRLEGATGLRVDFVRARAETYPEPAALPKVRPGTLEEDLRRRDFSINAMAAAIRPDGTARLVDPLGGSRDLRARRLRVLHRDSFRDDPTRIFRAARFVCRFGFKLDDDAERQLREALRDGWIERLSRERLRGELLRILGEKDPVGALRLLKQWKLVGFFHPKFAWPEELAEVEGPWERLGVMALHMGTSGKDFVLSLNLERSVSQALSEAWDVFQLCAVSRRELSPLARRALKSFHEVNDSDPLPKAALKPLLVNGEDLSALGLKSGPDFRVWLDHAARAQWEGEFSTRPQALGWLRSRLESGISKR